MPPQPSSQKYRLTASAIASHFKHRCDRLFRWNAVAGPDRGRAGIGWNVPRRARLSSRPGIALLMAAGDEFEIERVQALEREVAQGAPVSGCEPRLHYAGVQDVRGRRQITPVPLADALALLRQPTPPRFVAQVEIDLASCPEIIAHFLHRFGLDPNAIDLGTARPDLIEVVPADDVHPQRRLRVWDVKGSQVPRHEHFIQVAYYGMLLESALAGLGVTDLAVDTSLGVIEARQERLPFDLAPYRLALADFLRNRVPALLATPAADAHFHVHEGCVLCEYMDECRAQADAAYDLSRLPYITSESKRHLRAAGFRSHTDLVGIEPARDQERIEQLRALSHDLSTNITRYITAARALRDGERRVLEQRTFQMPRWEDVRVVLSAEQDAVTGTCFALGIKTHEGWDEAENRPRGEEHVFIATTKGDEVSVLLPFLGTLNRLLERVHAANEAVRARPVEEDARVVAANQAVADAQAALDDFKATHAAETRRRTPEAQALRAEREALQQAVNAARKAAKEVSSQVFWEQRKQQQRLHFYIYDTLDVLALKGLIERHLFDEEPPELLAELSNLIRLFPPESVLPDADTFRTIPGTVVVNMLRSLVALPIPYGYDLRAVSDLYQPERGGFRFRTPYGFSWEHSNQIAFERIHEVWNGEAFSHQSGGRTRVYAPAEILVEIDKAIRAKLRATDAVVRRLKEDLDGRLLLKKEPFRLFTGMDPLQLRMLEALRVFTTLEVSHDELETKRVHTLPASDRVASFVCLHDLRAEAAELDAGGALWFTFDPAGRDTKFEPGDFDLALTPADEPEILLSEIDGDLFANSASRWRYAPYKVTLLEYDLQASPPRVRLKPDNRQAFLRHFNPARAYVLDRLFVDYNSAKVLEVLQGLAASDGQAGHIHALLAEATIDGWTPLVSDVAAVETDLRACLSAAGADPDRLLNPGQWRAWRGVFREPLTLVWGPPGTGKTHTIAHILIGYALAARRLGQPIRVLVSAFTHHAINNVLAKVAELAGRYGLGADDLQLVKLERDGARGSTTTLPAGVMPVDPDGFHGTLTNAVPCQVAGATVWATHRAMRDAGSVAQPWFDVVLIDEASQMKAPDALIAFAASKPGTSIILAGDDRQLPPIIHGVYPEEHDYLLSSVFAFVRDRIERQRDTRPALEERILFQLEENFRMNEPLTAYPRDVLYQGRFSSTTPGSRIVTAPPLPLETEDPLDFLLHPDRPVVLVRYPPPRSFTARNPLEADLAARLVDRLRTILVDSATGQVYTPERLAREGVAVLSPHRAQNSAIRQALRELSFGTDGRPMPLVDTVDKLQGQERDVVIVSYGVADGEYAEAEAAFLLSSNRFNVAATRARHKLIVLCADTVLDLVPPDQQVLLDAMMLKEFRRYCDSGTWTFPWTSGDGETTTLRAQWRAFPS